MHMKVIFINNNNFRFRGLRLSSVNDENSREASGKIAFLDLSAYSS